MHSCVLSVKDSIQGYGYVGVADYAHLQHDSIAYLQRTEVELAFLPAGFTSKLKVMDKVIFKLQTIQIHWHCGMGLRFHYSGSWVHLPTSGLASTCGSSTNDPPTTLQQNLEH